MHRSNPDNLSRQGRPSPFARALVAMAVVAAVLLVAVGLIRLVSRAGGFMPLGLEDLTIMLVYLAAGVVCGGLLAGLAVGLGLLRKVLDSLIRLEQFRYDERRPADDSTGEDQSTKVFTNTSADRAPIEGPPTMDGAMHDMVRLLEDIRDNSLLSDEERREKARRFANEEIEESQMLIRSMISRRDFVQARHLAGKIQGKFPHDPRGAALVEQVEEARERLESEDVDSAIRQVQDLITISAWQRARELAQQLQERHPDSAEARQLLLRIEQDHRAFQEEQRRRMYAEIQRFVTRRRWEEALVAARIFIERFPECEETSALHLELPTLQTNAEIEIRQKFEARIMDLMRDSRYTEALELAEKVIEQYPESPQAEALKGQLDRLEQLANNPEAPPVRSPQDD